MTGSKNLDGAVKALLVGGAEGFLGLESVVHFANSGRRVAASVRTKADEERVRSMLQKRGVDAVRTYVCDLGDERATGEMIARAEADLGPIDGLFNAAGGFRWGTTPTLAPADLDFLWTANFKTAFNLARHMIPRMAARKAGRVVFVSSRATLEPVGAGMGAYVATKAAINALVSALAAENRDAGLNINAVLPSTIDTPANRQSMPGANFAAWVSIEALLGVIELFFGKEGAPLNGALLPVSGRV